MKVKRLDSIFFIKLYIIKKCLGFCSFSVISYTANTWIERPCFIFIHPDTTAGIRNIFLLPFSNYVWLTFIVFGCIFIGLLSLIKRFELTGTWKSLMRLLYFLLLWFKDFYLIRFFHFTFTVYSTNNKSNVTNIKCISNNVKSLYTTETNVPEYKSLSNDDKNVSKVIAKKMSFAIRMPTMRCHKSKIPLTSVRKFNDKMTKSMFSSKNVPKFFTKLFRADNGQNKKQQMNKLFLFFDSFFTGLIFFVGAISQQCKCH